MRRVRNFISSMRKAYDPDFHVNEYGVFIIPSAVFSFGTAFAFYNTNNMLGTLACIATGVAASAYVVDKMVFGNRLLGYVMKVPNEFFEYENSLRRAKNNLEAKFSFENI